MRISIRCSHRPIVFTIDVEPSDTIATLKANIQDRTGIPPNQQHITERYSGRALKDCDKIRDYNIKNNTILNLSKEWSWEMLYAIQRNRPDLPRDQPVGRAACLM